jgi:hypothetical protein
MSNPIAQVIAFLAALGVGSITAALIGWFNAISGYRQAWINAVREDIAEFFKQMHVFARMISSYPDSSSADKDQKIEQARLDAEFYLRRIKMRLNTTETLHQELATLLTDIQDTTHSLVDRVKADKAIVAAQALLKEEWSATNIRFFALQSNGASGIEERAPRKHKCARVYQRYN